MGDMGDMGDYLTAGRRDEQKARDRINDHAGEQHTKEAGEQLSANPALQMQSFIGNRAMLELLKNGSLSGTVKEKSTGSKLPAGLKEKMEASFGTDFSDVTVHESQTAAQMGARAFARHNSVHFAPGQFSPASPEGQKLLGHELTHVVQQRQGRVSRPQGRDNPVVFNPALEQEADLFGERASRGMPVSPGFAMSIASSAAPQLDSSAPIQGSFFGSIGRFAKTAMGGAMKLGKSFVDAGGVDLAKGAISGFMGAKSGGMGAGAAGALEGAGGMEGLLGFGKSLLGGLFGGGKKKEEEAQ